MQVATYTKDNYAPRAREFFSAWKPELQNTFEHNMVAI